GSCSRALVCPTRHDHGDREQSPGTRRTVPQADTCTATRHDLVRATSPTPGPHRPPSSARSHLVRPRRPLIQPAMRTVYSPHYSRAPACLISARAPAQGGEIFLGAVGAFAMDSYAARAWGGLPIAPRRLRFSAGPRLPEPDERSCSRGF